MRKEWLLTVQSEATYMSRRRNPLHDVGAIRRGGSVIELTWQICLPQVAEGHYAHDAT